MAHRSHPLSELAVRDIRALASRQKAKALFREAQQCYREGRDREAVTLCREVLRHCTDYAPAMALAAHCSALLKERPQAEEFLSAALAHGRDDPYVLHLAGRTCEKLGRNCEARSWFERCLERDPRYFRAECDLTHIALRQRNYAEMRRRADRTLEVNPTCFCMHAYRLVGQKDLNRSRSVQLQTIEAGLAGNPLLYSLHAFREILMAEKQPLLSEAIDAVEKTEGRVALKRIRGYLRDSDFEGACRTALSLKTPCSLEVLKYDFAASSCVQLAARSTDPDQRSTYLSAAARHLDRAEDATPGYWLTQVLRRKLRV